MPPTRWPGSRIARGRCWSGPSSDDDGSVKLLVRDSGTGIDPAIIEKLFEAFYTTKAKGMGVGLSISRSIIERHGGRLWAEANEGPGATFSFSIPGAPVHAGRV